MKKYCAAAILLSLLLPFSSAKAASSATTILSGGASLKGNYDITDTEDDTTDTWGSSANIFLSLVHSRQAEKGELSLRYSTNYQYDIKDETSSWSDQRFTLDGWRDLSSRLRFNISDTFIATNDLWAEWLSPTSTGIPDQPDQPGEPVDSPDGQDTDTTNDDSQPTLSEKIGQEKFWQNYFTTNFDYQYAQRGTITLGYDNRILEYDEPNRDNYMYNKPWIQLSYGFNPRWDTNLFYSYTDADYDISKDFVLHDAGINLNYQHSVQDTFSTGFKYIEKEYETLPDDIQIGRSDYYAVRIDVSWNHAFSPQKSLLIAAGPEYLNYKDQDDYWSQFFNIHYRSRFKNGNWFVQAKGGFDDRSFNGLNEGVSEYQEARAQVSWIIIKDMSASLGASLRTDDFLENPFESDEKTYNAFANLSYRFSRWFYVSGRYWYVKNDTDISADSYDEHRFFITLGASKELYRWIH